jgi:glycosyltransferase involved in cell wall biosynthesis
MAMRRNSMESSNPKRETISVCITAGNEEKNIRRCLESVTWADEILVVDSFSTDRTPEICREYTNLVYEHKWLGYIGQKNLIKDLATCPWILFVDADEEVSLELRDEILRSFEGGETETYAGFEFPRIVHYLGRWIRHGDWYPDVKLRLFRRDRGTCGGKEPHDQILVDGPVKRLRGHMHHFTYTGILDQIATINRFTSITAETKFRDGRRSHLTDLLLRPVFRFFRGYFIRGGFLDGLPGLIIAASTSYGVFAKYAKLWELHKQKNNATF